MTRTEDEHSLIQHLKQHPGILMIRDCNNNLPLHYLFSEHCHFRSKLNSIEMCPDAVQQRNNNNEFPLHLAIRQPSDFLIIQTLIELYPESLTYPHADGSYPLHKLLLQHKNKHSSASIIRWDTDTRHDKILRDIIESQPLFVQNIAM
jgi:hypothetical protein